MWEEEYKRQEGMPDVKSSVQGQTMFMLHPLFSEKMQSATSDAGARWNESHAYMCTHIDSQVLLFNYMLSAA